MRLSKTSFTVLLISTLPFSQSSAKWGEEERYELYEHNRDRAHPSLPIDYEATIKFKLLNNIILARFMVPIKYPLRVRLTPHRRWTQSVGASRRRSRLLYLLQPHWALREGHSSVHYVQPIITMYLSSIHPSSTTTDEPNFQWISVKIESTL